MKRSWITVTACIALLIIWENAVRLLAVPLYILPAPSDIARALWDMRTQLGEHTLVTLGETLLGMLCATVLGVAFALIMDASPTIKATLYPLLATSQAVPVLVIAPLLIIYLGFGLAPKVFSVALMCFFPITVSLSASMAQVGDAHIHMLQSLGARGRFPIYRFLKLPAALPGFFSGLRVSVTYSVTGAVVGEWLSSRAGLGFLMLRAKNAYMLDRVYALLLVIIALSLLLLGLVLFLERICLPYRRKSSTY